MTMLLFLFIHLQFIDWSPVSNVHIMKMFNGQANLLHDQRGFLFSESILVGIQNLEVLLK